MILNNHNKKDTVLRELYSKREYYMMAVPGILYFFVFSYLPLVGIILAFKNFNIQDGILGSPWVGLKNFEFYFLSDTAWRTTRNTLVLNMLFIFCGLLFQMGYALMLNEMVSKLFKKLFQSFMFLPYFISWVIASTFVMNLFGSNYGIVNELLEAIGMERVQWFYNAKYWPAILTGLSLWKNTGFGVIIYLAVITGIDIKLYEAAELDGANRFQKIRYITLPYLIQTAIILVLLAIGKIFYGDFGMIYSIVGDNGMLLETTDVIDTYVFRALRNSGDFGMSTAIGLYQSVVGFMLVFASNALARKYQSDSALF